MELILVDDILSLGRRGDVVRVADGYGRNFLIPKKLAIPATPGNLKMVEQQRVALAKKEAKHREEAELVAKELGELHGIISRKTGETGTLFGSVTSKDIADLLEKHGVHLDRRKILLVQPIKMIGNYPIEIRPHPDVEAELLVSVVVEEDAPVLTVKKKDKESEKILAAVEAKLKELQELTGEAAATPDEEQEEQEDVQENKESTE